MRQAAASSDISLNWNWNRILETKIVNRPTRTTDFAPFLSGGGVLSRDFRTPIWPYYKAPFSSQFCCTRANAVSSRDLMLSSMFMFSCSGRDFGLYSCPGAPVRTRLHWTADFWPVWSARRDGRRCWREAHCGRQTKINWTKTAYHKLVHVYFI